MKALDCSCWSALSGSWVSRKYATTGVTTNSATKAPARASARRREANTFVDPHSPVGQPDSRDAPERIAFLVVHRGARDRPTYFSPVPGVRHLLVRTTKV